MLEVWYSLDRLDLRRFTGKRVASRKEDLHELVEHFNVSVSPNTCMQTACDLLWHCSGDRSVAS